MFKVHNKFSPEIVQEVFLVKEQGSYSLRNQTDFVFSQVRSVNYGLDSIQVLRPTILDSPLNALEKKNRFKTAIARKKPESCPCRLCKTCLQNIDSL